MRRESDLKKDLKKDKMWGWVNLYGAAVRGVNAGSAAAKTMAKFNEYASTYRGRVLVNAAQVRTEPTSCARVRRNGENGGPAGTNEAHHRRRRRRRQRRRKKYKSCAET